MFPSTIIFQTYKDISNQRRRVSLGDEDIQLSIIGQGRVEFLGESLYVPKLKFGLISISYFDQQGFSIVVKDNMIRVFDLNDRLHIEGHLCNNLYYLNDEYIDKMLYTGTNVRGHVRGQMSVDNVRGQMSADKAPGTGHY
jgi:hypothetical protein